MSDSSRVLAILAVHNGAFIVAGALLGPVVCVWVGVLVLALVVELLRSRRASRVEAAPMSEEELDAALAALAVEFAPLNPVEARPVIRLLSLEELEEEINR